MVKYPWTTLHDADGTLEIQDGYFLLIAPHKLPPMIRIISCFVIKQAKGTIEFNRKLKTEYLKNIGRSFNYSIKFNKINFI